MEEDFFNDGSSTNRHVVTYHVITLISRLARLVIMLKIPGPPKIFFFPSYTPRSKNRNQSLQKSRRESISLSCRYIFLKKIVHRTKNALGESPRTTCLPSNPLLLLPAPTDTLFFSLFFPPFFGKGRMRKGGENGGDWKRE